MAQSSLVADAVDWPVIVASLSLIGIAVVLSSALGLGIGRDLVESSTRAAVQLLVVGLLLAAAFGSTRSFYWAWLWVLAMVGVASVVIVRRAKTTIPQLRLVAPLVVAATALISIGVTFGFGVIGYEAVSVVVIAGITIGNAVPSAVLGVTQSVSVCRDRMGEVEALLALGLERHRVVRLVAPRAARAAMIPQIERTRVVGLIALPGAMTGLLLAGVEPIQAVVVQLLVMYLVLGTTAVCVVSVVLVIIRASMTTDLRVAEWVKP